MLLLVLVKQGRLVVLMALTPCYPIQYGLRVFHFVFFVSHAIQRIFFLGYNRFHVTEFLFEGCEHLLWNLKLNGTWVVLYGQGIVPQVLNELLILYFIITLSHLKDHVFITFQFLRRYRQLIILIVHTLNDLTLSAISAHILHGLQWLRAVLGVWWRYHRLFFLAWC